MPRRPHAYTPELTQSISDNIKTLHADIVMIRELIAVSNVYQLQSGRVCDDVLTALSAYANSVNIPVPTTPTRPVRVESINILTKEQHIDLGIRIKRHEKFFDSIVLETAEAFSKTSRQTTTARHLDKKILRLKSLLEDNLCEMYSNLSDSVALNVYFGTGTIDRTCRT